MKNDHALNTKEFLNPNSMLTPGFAGGMTMMITNTVAAQFDLGYPWSAVVGLLISLLFGLLAITATAIPSWQKLIYYVLNSLIIFTVAVGSNTLGRATTDSSSGHTALERDIAPLAALSIPAAHAQPLSQPAPVGWCCLNKKVNPSPQEECDRWGGQFFSTQEKAEQACRAAEANKREKAQGFFQPWFKK